MKKDSVLIVIDAQVGLIKGCEGIVDAEKVLDNINALIRKARSLKVPVLFVQDSDVGDPGSHEWQIDPRLDAKEGDLRVEKSVCDAFHETSLKSMLNKHGLKHLVLTGFKTEYCVDTTVRRAPSEGFCITLVSDGHGTNHNAGLSAQQIVDYHNLILHEFGAYIAGKPFEVIVSPTENVTFDRTLDVPSSVEWDQ
jgi:nicotinamidase-related amidase